MGITYNLLLNNGFQKENEEEQYSNLFVHTDTYFIVLKPKDVFPNKNYFEFEGHFEVYDDNGELENKIDIASINSVEELQKTINFFGIKFDIKL